MIACEELSRTMSKGIVLPGSESSKKEDPATAKYADRLDTIKGKTIAYVDWGKPNGDRLYEIFETVFTEEFGVESVDYYKKPTPSSPIPRETYTEILESDAEAVIMAIADCGSCNTSIVVDAISFEEENIPTVQIITTKFLDLNTKISKSKGYDKLPLITIDHPSRYLDESEVREVAENIKWTVEQIITCEDCLIAPTGSASG